MWTRGTCDIFIKHCFLSQTQFQDQDLLSLRESIIVDIFNKTFAVNSQNNYNIFMSDNFLKFSSLRHNTLASYLTV